MTKLPVLSELGGSDMAVRAADADDPDYLERFGQELELTRRIQSAHVVKVLGFGMRQGA